MAILSPVIRGGPLLGVLVALSLAAAPATASDGQRHYYSIQGSLTPTASPTSSGGGLEMKSRIAATPSALPQSAGNFVLTARLAASPLGCAGDTIFEDGFDP